MVLKQLVVFADSDVSLHLETVADQAAISSNTVSPAPLRIRRSTANKRYIDKFVEVKVRMTPEHRTEVQQHAQEMGESTTAFINRAIDETMERDSKKNK